MGTKQQTDTTNKYDPQAMQGYQSMQGPLAQTTNSYMQNPFGNPFFQTQQQLGTRQAQQLGGTQMGNVTRNITASGMGGGNMSPMALEMLQNQGRANSGMQAQLGFLNPVQNALGMQQNAMGLASNYRPLQTGGTQTQTTGGLGTWLPQLAGAAIGGMTGMGGLGALGGLFKGGGGGGNMYSGAGASPLGFNSAMGGSSYPGPAPDMGMPSFMGGMQAPGMGGGDWFGQGISGQMGSGSGASGMGGFPWNTPQG